ncbi:hypothetical protein QVD17_31522 [Tagetes erecta]|uniref:Uncharacterized protein n=1 Tax=Tagetes erecta TaxID=13708 RepID=A0AAD8K7R0_TARER|nr:hypothetical protein QVD17_31522 [Tagetes erecta]
MEVPFSPPLFNPISINISYSPQAPFPSFSIDPSPKAAASSSSSGCIDLLCNLSLCSNLLFCRAGIETRPQVIDPLGLIILGTESGNAGFTFGN